MSATRYLAPGVDTTLFQYSLGVVRSDVGVDTGPSEVSLYPITVSCTP